MYYLVFFLLQIFKNQKTSSSVQKTPFFLTRFWPCCYCWCFLFQKQPFTDVLQNRLKTLQNHKKMSVSESCFNKVAGLQKETLLQMFSSKFCKIFKKICFIEHPRATASAFWRSNNQSRCKKILHYKNFFLDTTKTYLL